MGYTRKNKVQLSRQLKLGVGRGYSRNNLLKYTGFGFLVISLGLVAYTGSVILSHEKAANNSTNGNVLGATDTPEQPFINYTVQKGDTIFNIAQKFKIANWATLATINNLAAPYSLTPGQVIKVPNQ